MSGLHTQWLEPGPDSRFRSVSVFGLAFGDLSDGTVPQEPNTSCMASKSRFQGCVLIETGEYTVKDINRAAWEGSLLAFGQLSGLTTPRHMDRVRIRARAQLTAHLVEIANPTIGPVQIPLRKTI